MAELRKRPGDQPLPVPNNHPDIQSAVIADLVARRELGIQRYGTALQPFNQRDGLIDAYEESVDLVCYLRQLVAERGMLAHETRKLVAAAVAEAWHADAEEPAVTDRVMQALGPLLTAAAFRTEPGMVSVRRADLELILALDKGGPFGDAEDAAVSRLLGAVEPS